MGDSADDYDIEFNFENESLKHRLDSTMREDMFQVSQHAFSYLLNLTIYTFIKLELDWPRPWEQAQD